MQVLCEKIEVYGFRAALRGMRNPVESWATADSKFWGDCPHFVSEFDIFFPERAVLGPEDLKTACRLIALGTDHRKFMRQIQVWVDFIAPRAVWQEIDTYKVSTTRDSCSTMHKLDHRDLVSTDFQDEDISASVLSDLNELGAICRETKSAEDLHHLKMHLPEGFRQRATYTMSYETCLNMYFARRKHRMKEWSGVNGICAMIAQLPYMDKFLAAAEAQRIEAAENKKLLGQLAEAARMWLGDRGPQLGAHDALRDAIKAVGK
jgi:hypothetical protein